MPRGRGVRGRKGKVKGKMTLSEVRKRLMELKIMHQDYIRNNKSIAHNDAIMYIEQMNTYKEQFYDNDEILQVIRGLTIRFEAIITGEDAEIKYSQKNMSPVYSQIGNIQINTKINDVFDALENTVSPVYSENEEDKIQTFRIHNISNSDNKKTKEARNICEHSEGSNKETVNLNTIGGNSKDYDLNDEYSESILSNYHSNLNITHTVNDKSNKIEINKPLNDNNIKETKTKVSLAAKDHTVLKKQKILSQAIFSDDDDDDDDDVVYNKNIFARTTNSEIRNFTIKRPSLNTSVSKIRKPKKIFGERFLNETGLYSHDKFSDTNFELINGIKAVEATVNNKSQAIVKRTNENTNDKENNIFNCKSTETSCVQRKNDNKSEKNKLTVDSRIQKNRFLLNDVTIIRKPVLEHKNKTLFNENLVTEYSNVDTCSLDHTIGTSNTENINVALKNNETKVNENFLIPKPAYVTKKPKASRKKPMKPKKDTNLVVNWITEINNKIDKTNKKHNFEQSENSIATSVNTEQESSTNCDTSIINSNISEAEFSDNRPTKNNETMNEVDLSWIEKIKSVRIIDEDEYDPKLNNLSDRFWTDSTLPIDCSVSELFD